MMKRATAKLKQHWMLLRGLVNREATAGASAKELKFRCQDRQERGWPHLYYRVCDDRTSDTYAAEKSEMLCLSCMEGADICDLSAPCLAVTTMSNIS